ncbi:MAG: OmpA family protein [Spirochaetes bacterium]|nr:OmpA family protein [Spirochaetota bacterium]
MKSPRIRPFRARPFAVFPLLLALSAFPQGSAWKSAGTLNTVLPEDPAFQPRLDCVLRLVKREYLAGEPVLARLTLHNNTGDGHRVRLRLSENLFHHLDLVGERENGSEVEESEGWKIWKLEKKLGKAKADASRQLELRDEESFTLTVDLAEFLDFGEAGYYTVEGNFSPNILLDGQRWTFKVPEASFRILPGAAESPKPAAETAAREESAAAPPAAFDPRSAGPDRVAERLLEYQVKHRWAEFLELVDAPSLLVNSYTGTEFFERYRSARAAERLVIAAEFRDWLVKNLDYRIDSWELQETRVVGERARVTAQARVRQPRKKWSHQFDIRTGQFVYRWENLEEPDLVQNSVFTLDLERGAQGWKVTRVDVSLRKNPPPTLERAQAPLRREPLVLPNILFARGLSELLPESFPSLDRLRDELLRTPSMKIELRGHTDNVGDRLLNQNLSGARAAAVRQYLVDHGIGAGRIRAEGYGPDKPLTDNRSEAARAKNRRVELVVLEP